MRDIIVMLVAGEFVCVTLNGEDVWTLEYSYDATDLIKFLFDKVGDFAKKPLVQTIDLWDYFSEFEQEVLLNSRDEKIFTNKELELLDICGVQEFIEEVKKRIEIEANQMAKDIQEM